MTSRYRFSFTAVVKIRNWVNLVRLIQSINKVLCLSVGSQLIGAAASLPAQSCHGCDSKPPTVCPHYMIKIKNNNLVLTPKCGSDDAGPCGWCWFIRKRIERSGFPQNKWTLSDIQPLMLVDFVQQWHKHVTDSRVHTNRRDMKHSHVFKANFFKCVLHSSSRRRQRMH